MPIGLGLKMLTARRGNAVREVGKEKAVEKATAAEDLLGTARPSKLQERARCRSPSEGNWSVPVYDILCSAIHIVSNDDDVRNDRPS